MHKEPALLTEPLLVTIVDGEVVISCEAMPSLSPEAARATAVRLAAAANLALGKLTS